MSDNAKRLAFAREYCVDRNATQAAIRAGYSKGTAKQQGSRLLTYDDVQRAIAAQTNKVADKLEITLERIISMLVEDREFAREKNAAGAATAATMGLAKVTGYLVEDRKNSRDPFDGMTTEQLLELANVGGSTTTH